MILSRIDLNLLIGSTSIASINIHTNENTTGIISADLLASKSSYNFSKSLNESILLKLIMYTMFLSFSRGTLDNFIYS